MPGRKFVSGEEYRFGFNGKEDDQDWGTQNIQDYGFRLYNPSIGKFLSVDPLAPKYPELTPYQFASNTPIAAIDLDGLEAYFVFGTGQDPSWWNNSSNANIVLSKIPNLFRNSTTISTSLPTNIWDGGNSVTSRMEGADNLASYISSTRTGTEPITIVGHSHGGNVAIYTAHILITRHQINPKDINLVLLNTPDRVRDKNYGFIGPYHEIQDQLGNNTYIKYPFLPPLNSNTYEIDANWDVVKYWGEAASWTQDNMCPEYLDVLWRQKHYFDLRIDYVDQYPQYGDGWASWANHLGTMDKNVGVWFAPLERHVKATRPDLYPNSSSSSYTPQNGTDYKVETPK